VRWAVVQDILYAWILTIPITAILSAIFYFIISFIANF